MIESNAHRHAPDLVELSAYVDGELAAESRQRVDSHLAVCPDCATQVARFASLSADFAKFREESLGFDLAGVIEGRIAATERRPGRASGRGRFVRWSIALGAAGALVAGTQLGTVLVAGSGAGSTPPVATLRVFDAMPPGNLCVGLDSCFVKGGRQ
ncbi:MAG: zf-HC2 domain-containing protein [Dechloromonas sp.]|nr:zf-HC2 domain-containing protein [Dechloromonas sp.]